MKKDHYHYLVVLSYSTGTISVGIIRNKKATFKCLEEIRDDLININNLSDGGITNIHRLECDCDE